MSDPRPSVIGTSEIREYLSKRALEARGSDIELLERGLFDALSRFQERLNSVSASSLATRSAEGKWSPAEVADHLYLANTVFIRAVQTATQDRPLTLAKGRVGPDGKLIAHPSTWPKPDKSLESLSTNLDTSCRILIEEVRGLADQGIADTHCFVSPYYGSLSAIECLQLAIVHILHHTKQLPT